MNCNDRDTKVFFQAALVHFVHGSFAGTVIGAVFLALQQLR